MNAGENNSADMTLMPPRKKALCIGSVHWDWVGSATTGSSNDLPGVVERKLGGVAFNVASGLKYFGIDSALLGAVGSNNEGDELIDALNRTGLHTEFLLQIPGSRTDRYLAIESHGCLVAAIADTRTLEQAGSKILEILQNEESLAALQDWSRIIVADGNLPLCVLAALHGIQQSLGSKIAIVCASTGKVSRLSNLVNIPYSTIYLNLHEANLLLDRNYRHAKDAAKMLCEIGFNRVAVTNGPCSAAVASLGKMTVCRPPEADAIRATGAGDAFAAAHIAMELKGGSAKFALESAVLLASSFAAGDLEY